MTPIRLYDIAPRLLPPDVDAAGYYYECEVCRKPFADDEESPRTGEVIQHVFIWSRCKDCAWENEDEQ